MSKDKGTQTIAAIATPLGSGGIGIVRLSGPDSLAIGQRLFRSARQGFAGPRPYRLHHGWVQDPSGQDLDEVLVSYMPGPGSYTGEDCLEINCHGGPAVLQSVLESCLRLGARPAEPGEFTKRAFLSGRLDLTQAEAVAEMISAPTQGGLRLASSKLAGGLGRLVTSLSQRVRDLQVRLTVDLDFPEQGLTELSEQDLRSGLQAILDEIQPVLDNFERDRYWRDGALVVLAGLVNAGKSSLLNAILGRERAIVNALPGTTRDYLEEQVNLGGLPVRLVDTAGLRSTSDQVEQAGLDRAQDLLVRADLVCFVLDVSQPLSETDQAFLVEVDPNRALIVLNKQDLEADQGLLDWVQSLKIETVPAVAIAGSGVEELTQAVRSRLVGRRQEPGSGELVPNLRQRRGLERARSELWALIQDLDQGLPLDLLGVRLETAASALGEVIGEVTPSQVLDQVFERFCIGK